MANDERTGLGLRPLNQPYGTFRVNYYRANTAVNMFRFQPVALNNSGQVQVKSIADMSGMLGVIVGFLDASKGSLPSDMTSLSLGAYLRSGNDSFVAVADDPNQEFVIEADTGGGTIGSLNSAGQTISFVYQNGTTTDGNVTTGIANVLLDSSTTATSTAGILTLVRPFDRVNQDGTINSPGNFEKWVVYINSHQKGPLNQGPGGALGLPG